MAIDVMSGLFLAAPMPDTNRGSRPMPRPAGWKLSRLLGRLVPAVQALLQLLCSGFRSLRAVQHVGADRPELVLQVRRAAGEDLVRVPDRAFAVLAPADE